MYGSNVNNYSPISTLPVMSKDHADHLTFEGGDGMGDVRTKNFADRFWGKKHLSRRVLLGKKSYTLHFRKKILLLGENVLLKPNHPYPTPHQHHPKVKWSVPKILEQQVQPGWLLIQLSVRLQTVPLLRWAPDMDNDLLSGLSLISFPESFSPSWPWSLAQEACNWLIIRRFDKLVHVISWRAATERVCINGVISSSLPITLGVSQGSILGALVFTTNCILHEHEHLCRRYWLNL